MATDIPDIQFPSYDDYRMWERSLASAKLIVELLEENKNNIALVGALMDSLHEWANDNGNWFNERILDWLDENPDKNYEILIKYGNTAMAIVNESIQMNDQLVQIARREGRNES